MHKLVILTVHNPMASLKDQVANGAFEFETEDQAALRALLWLKYCPDDVVMYLEPA